MGVILIACFALVLVQLTNIQFRRASALATSAQNPINQAVDLNNVRGDILAADGTVLATSVPVAKNSTYPYHYQREYPGGSLYSQLIGTCSPFYCDTGVEDFYNSELKPHSQQAQTLSQLLSPPPPTTDTITLTINPALQSLAAQELNSLPGPNKDGAVVVLNPKTGAILAMYSSPTYDPTPLTSIDYRTETGAESLFSVKDPEGFYPIQPIATYNALQPGSTSKVLTTAAVYNLAPGLTNFNFPVAPCLTNIPETNKTICNDADTAQAANPCGGTMTQMLPESCDPGYAALGLALGPGPLSQQANLLGYNVAPPLDMGPDPASVTGSSRLALPVQPSSFPSAAALSPGAPSGQPGTPGLAYAAFGQENVFTTALQNALIAAAVADGGTIMVPHLLDRVANQQGQVVRTYQPTVWKQAMSQYAAGQITPLMQAVATSGTAAGVFPSSLNVAVKTGTAQNASADGTTIASVNDWMIGFAPADNPQIAIAVVVPYQPTSTTGAEIAGPIVNAMLAAALR
jgi:penicillin-binding protein A